MHRRLFLAAALALAAVSAAAAQAPDAAPKTVEAGKAFPFLERYLRLPAAERDRFAMAYYLQVDGKPAAGLKGWIADGATRQPIPVGPGGRVERLPTLEQIRAKRTVTFDAPANAKFGMNLQIEPAVRPAPEMPAAELAAAVAQAGRGAKKAAGLMRLAVPRFDAVRFTGAEGGEVVAADGRAVALPVEKGAPVFRPAQHPTARTVRFRTPPRGMLIITSG